MRRLLAVGVSLCAVVLAAGDSAAAAPCWLPPVDAPVSDPYREPACRWCPGNRGIEYRVRPHTVIRSVAAGVVTFSGSVAGVDYVVVAHADGRRTTYGSLVDRSVGRGDRVAGRSRIGSATGRFHFGLRVGDRYVDPTPLLGRLEGTPRLIPLDGTPARPAPPATVRCTSRRTSR